MKYVSAYLMAVLAGKENPSAADIQKILESVEAEYDASVAEKLVSELSGKTIHEVVAAVAAVARPPRRAAVAAVARPRPRPRRRSSRKRRKRRWTSTSSAERSQSEADFVAVAAIQLVWIQKN